MTVVRFHPEPKFHFDKESYVAQFCGGEDSDVWKAFLDAVRGREREREGGRERGREGGREERERDRERESG